MANRRKLHKANLYHKIIHNKIPHVYKKTVIREAHNINISDKNFVNISQPKTSLFDLLGMI